MSEFKHPRKTILSALQELQSFWKLKWWRRNCQWWWKHSICIFVWCEPLKSAIWICL